MSVVKHLISVLTAIWVVTGAALNINTLLTSVTLLPQKAIIDLNKLIEVFPDYRKTIYIVLSSANRRGND